MRRPINFIVVVWGTEFCGYFLRFCLSSLLAPNNIPKLCSHRDRFLIATTADDRRMLEGRPEMRSLRRFLTVEYTEIDKPRPGVPSVTHSNKHLIGLLQRTWERREYGVMMSPDEIFSNELGDVIAQSIADEVGLLLLPTVRLAKEPFFSAMAAEGCDLDGLSDGATVDVRSRTLAIAAIAGLHPEILAGEWDTLRFGDYINSVWWKMNGRCGILLHTFSFIPLLMDYALVEQHDVRDALVSNTDGPYLSRNFPPGTKIRIIDDADTAFTASWAPYAQAVAGILRPKWAFTIPWLGERLKGAYLRRRYRYYVVECRDWIKAAMFARPLRWRVGGQDEDWKIAEAKANRSLSKHLPGYAPANIGADWTPDQLDRSLSSGLNPVFDQIVFWYQRYRAYSLSAKEHWAVIWDAVRGNKVAMRRIMRRVVRLAP